MTAWREKEVDAARHRQEKREATTGNDVIAHGSIELCEATPIRLADGRRNPCRDERRTETCVAPWHV